MDHDAQVAHEILTSIRQIIRRISEYSKHLSKEVGLTVPQVMCLKAIGDAGAGELELTVAMVARRVQLSAATVSRIIERLARAGLVARARPANDRRRVCLTLTEAGVERYRTLPTPLQEQFLERLHALPEAETRAILDALRCTAELMDATELDAAPILTVGTDLKEERLV